MLKKNPTAQWTTAVSDAMVDDQTKQSSMFKSRADSDNRKSRDCPKLEALKQIYDEICAIRRSHAQIVAENTAKRAEVCMCYFFSFLYTVQMYLLCLLISYSYCRKFAATGIDNFAAFYHS